MTAEAERFSEKHIPFEDRVKALLSEYNRKKKQGEVSLEDMVRERFGDDEVERVQELLRQEMERQERRDFEDWNLRR